ncbi:MAG TPA: DNA replication and repair protein RecF [Solirubrobacterales bacterium]|jgi:DNA replication and repair protein RecF|nr:DNA replication and repair protein RecF [Solirubrobacterales bacterium]
MLVERLGVLGFRNLAEAELVLEPQVNLVWGPNGAGKTNVLEALYMALAGRSCRTASDRETIAFGEPLARAEAVVASGAERRSFQCAVSRADGRRHQVDGAAAGPEHLMLRPALAVFMPDRLVLVKGPPAARRAHLDRFCAALWPARVEGRRRYARALAQRNALIGRIRAGEAAEAGLDPWDAELGAAGVELMAVRAEAAERIAAPFATAAAELGLTGDAEVQYRPRSEAGDAAVLARELAERRESDLARGYTGHGPHLDELALRFNCRALRRYGSQGQQRVGLLALLFAEHEALVADGRPPPLMLLDDVTSELDPERRRLLCERLEAGRGQALITAATRESLPASTPRNEIALRDGRPIAPLAKSETDTAAA